MKLKKEKVKNKASPRPDLGESKAKEGLLNI